MGVVRASLLVVAVAAGVVGGASPASAETFEEAVIREVNAIRAAGASCSHEPGSPAHSAAAPLAREPQVSQAAQAHADYLAANHVLSHTQDPNGIGFTGQSPAERAAHVGYQLHTYAENIASIPDSYAPEVISEAHEVVQLWMTSATGHCSNLFSDTRDVGVGFAAAVGDTGEHYWVLNMATRMPGSDPAPTPTASTPCPYAYSLALSVRGRTVRASLEQAGAKRKAKLQRVDKRGWRTLVVKKFSKTGEVRFTGLKRGRNYRILVPSTSFASGAGRVRLPAISSGSFALR